jgi:hypothetical protein
MRPSDARGEITRQQEHHSTPYASSLPVTTGLDTTASAKPRGFSTDTTRQTMTPLLASGQVRMFRLSNDPGERGLSCTPDGVALAGVPLIRKTLAGFAPRPADEISLLLKAAYGDRPMALPSRLHVIAKALNKGDFAMAMIAAVHTRTPELDADAAARLAQAEKRLGKYEYNPDERRDWRGRWTTDGSAGPADTTASPIEVDDRTVAENTFPPGSPVLSDATGPSGGNSTRASDDRDDNTKQTTLDETFERKYDNLGPDEFSKKVAEFAYWLEAHGRQLSPEEKESATAEYVFVQNRVSAWLNYEYKSPEEELRLVFAGKYVYQGATNSGLVPISPLPLSMLVLGGTIALLDSPSHGSPRPAKRPVAEENGPLPLKPPSNIEFGVVVDRETAGIVWGKGIRAQGIGEGEAGWEKYTARQNPGAEPLPEGSKGFDLFNETTGEAISAKTLNTKTMSCIRKPEEIYNRVSRYVDKAVNYAPNRGSDVDPASIDSKTIELAIPE